MVTNICNAGEEVVIVDEQTTGAGNGILVETESFESYGGWSLDSQFAEQMGSPYLLAHGLGVPVTDARTSIDIPAAGSYAVWVRAKDWVPDAHPGRFEVHVNDAPLPREGGTDGSDWSWQLLGTIELAAGSCPLVLHDLTGFDGRCDAVFLTNQGDEPPEQGLEVNRAWRRRMLGIDAAPVDGGSYDVIVVGGGVPGCAAALASARSGSRVALIGDRPVLGGNASSEVGLGPRGYKTPFVKKLIVREPDGDLGCTALVEAEPGITLLLDEHVFAADKRDGRIVSVTSRNARTSVETTFRGEVFIDASGRAALARLVGAETRIGREGKAEFNESLAPDEPDEMHHGNTLLYHVGMASHPVTFPDVPWATEVAKDFACLAGQMGDLSEDNQPGPCIGGPGNAVATKVAQLKAGAKMVQGIKRDHMFPPEEVIHIFPGTHYWEYGQYLDMDVPGNEELVRDHLLRALYGTMSNIKRAQPDKYANLRFEWIHFVPARGEYCRIMGDYILDENDVRDHTEFTDAIVRNDGAFCLHYPGDEQYDFRLKKWVWDVRDQKPYSIPFRCLYSRNVPNLMMAGKHISVSRVVSSNIKMMANGAEHGVATGCAATLCGKYGCSPREIGADHFDELRSMVDTIS